MTASPVVRFDHARDLVNDYLAREGHAPAPEPLRHLLDSLLGGIRELDRERADRERRLERTQLESETDPLTGLLDESGWRRRLRLEEDRRRRFGDPVTVVTVALAGEVSGHDLTRAARTLRETLRPGDVLARTAQAGFAALLVAVSESEVVARAAALRRDLPGADVRWNPLPVTV